jgi:hypothetical protein
MSTVRTAIIIARPLRAALRQREAINHTDWPGHDDVSEIEQRIMIERMRVAYLVRALQNRHLAALLARAAGIPGYVYMGV